MSFHEDWSSLTSAQRQAVVLILIASGLDVLFGLLRYPVIGHDAYVHLNWLQQFCSLRSQGISYPRWLPQSFGGFGSPTFYFYPPLPFWIASFFYSLKSFSATTLFHFVQLLATGLSIVTCYFCLSRFNTNRILVFSGALLYACIGYHFCDVYIRNALGEHFSLLFFPLLFIKKSRTLQAISISAVAWAGLLLSNIPIAYISALTVAVYCVAEKDRSFILCHLAGLLLGLCVSAVYLISLASFRHLIHAGHLVDLDLNTSRFGYAITDVLTGHLDWLRIFGVITIVLCTLLLIFDWRKREIRSWRIIAIIALVLQIPILSTPLWQYIPGMSQLQFSWRWDVVLLLFVPVCFVTSNVDRVPRIIAALALMTILCELTIARNFVHPPRLATNEYHMDAPEYIPAWAASDPHEVIGLTLHREKEPDAVPLGLTASGDTISLVAKSPVLWKFNVRLSQETPVRFHMLYWPMWQLIMDRSLIPTSPDMNGYLSATLPAGHYPLALLLIKTNEESTGSTISICGVALLILLLAAASYQEMSVRRHRRDNSLL